MDPAITHAIDASQRLTTGAASAVVVLLAIFILGLRRRWWAMGHEIVERDKIIAKLESKDEKWNELLTRTIESIAPPRHRNQ